MDALPELVRDCRTLLFSIQMTLFGVLLWGAEDGLFRSLGLVFGAVAFVLVLVVGARMVPAPVDPDRETTTE